MDIDKMEAECATLNNKENKNLDNLNFHSSMDKFNMEIGVENDTNINNDNGLTDSEMDIELELLTKNINNIKQIAKNNNNKFVLNKNLVELLIQFQNYLKFLLVYYVEAK